MLEKLKNSRMFEKLKKVRSMQYFVFLLVLAIVLSIAGSLLTDDDKNNGVQGSDQKEVETTTTSETENMYETRLKRILSSIKGTGKVEVMITYKSSKEKIPALSTVSSNTNTEEKDRDGGVRRITQEDTNTQPVSVNTSEGTEALIVKEIEPEIQGVIVIAEGAGDLKVRLELERAVQTVLGIDSNQVEVFEMKKE